MRPAAAVRTAGPSSVTAQQAWHLLPSARPLLAHPRWPARSGCARSSRRPTRPFPRSKPAPWAPPGRTGLPGLALETVPCSFGKTTCIKPFVRVARPSSTWLSQRCHCSGQLTARRERAHGENLSPTVRSFSTSGFCSASSAELALVIVHSSRFMQYQEPVLISTCE